MSAQYHLSWSLEEFQTYLLLYCSNADIDQSARELAYIKQHLEKNAFRAIKEVFNNDTDHQSLTRLQQYIEHHNLNEVDLKKTLAKSKTLFEIDGTFDPMEQHAYNVLKRFFT